MKKGTIEAITEALEFVNTSSLTSDARKAIARNYINLSSIAKDVREKRTAASKKITPARVSELQKLEKRTESENIELDNLMRIASTEFAEVLTPLLDEEVEVNLTTISEEDFDSLVSESKDLRLRGFALLHEHLVQKPAEVEKPAETEVKPNKRKE